MQIRVNSKPEPQGINKKSNEMFGTEDITTLTTIASHVALNLEGEGSSIKKMLAFLKKQSKAVEQSYDFVRTATYVS